MAIEDILNDYSLTSSKLGDIGSIEPYYKPKKEKATLTFREPVGPTTSDNNSTSLLGDVGREALVGVLGTGAGYIEHGRKLGLISDETATRWQREGQEVSNKIAEHYSPEQKAANQVETFDSEGNFHMPSARKLGGVFVESLPTMLASVAPAAGATRALGLAGLSKGVAGAIGASAIEGLDAGAQNASQTRLKVLDKPIEELRQSPTFLSTLSQTDPNLSTEQREEQAKSIMAENAADQVYKETALSTGAIGLATGGGVIGAMLGRKGITQGLIKTLGADMRSEGLQETLQSGGEAYIQNKAEKDNVDPNKNVWEGVLNQSVEGGLVGAASGGAFGVLHHVSNNPNNKDEDKNFDTNPITGSKFVNKDTGNAYSAYVSTVGKVQDTTNPDYQAAFSASITSLQNVINEEQKKTNDPESEDGDSVKILEAQQALDSIRKTHQTILDTEKKMRDEEEALVKANKLKEDADKVKEAADILQEADDADSSIDEEVKKEQADMTPDELMSSFPIGQLTEESKNRIVDAGLATHEDLGTILPKEPTAPVEPPKEPTAPMDLQQGLKGMGESISSDFYNKAYEGLVDGTHTISGVKDSIFKQLVPAYRWGLIKSSEDVKNFLNKKPEERAVEYGVPVPDKINHPESYFNDLMAHTQAKRAYEKEYGAPLQDLPPAPPEIKTGEPKEPTAPEVKVEEPTAPEVKPKEPTVLSTPKAEPSSLQSVKDLLTDLKEHPEKLNDPVKKTNKPTKPKVTKEEKAVEAPIVSKEDQESMDLLSNQIEIQKQVILTRKEEGASHAELTRLAGIVLDHQEKLDAIKEKYPEVKEKPKRTRKVKEKVIEITPKLAPKEVEVATKAKKEEDLTKLAIDLEQTEEDNLDEDVKAAATELKLKKAKKEASSPIKELSFEDQAVIDNLQEQIDDLSQQILDEKERFAPASEIQGLINDRRDLIIKMKTLKGEDVNLKPGRKPLSWGSSKEEREGQDDSGLSTVQFDNSGLFTKPELDRVIIDHEEAKGIVGKIINALYSHIKEKVEIHYLEDFGWADWGERKVTTNLIMARGLFVAKDAKGNNTGKAHIYLNGARLKTRQELVGTLAHELIGHFGLKEVFGGNEKYVNFLINMLNSSPQMREDIVALLPGWRSYLTDWLSVNKLSDLPANRKMVFKIKGESVEMPASIAARLADEYMAELAKNKFSNEEFMRNEAGMGMKVPERSALMKRRETWFNNFLRKITHYIRAIFGIYTNAITPYDLTQAIAKSMDTLFHSLDEDMVFKGKNYVPPLEISMPNRHIQGGELAFDMADETQLSPEDVAIQQTITHLEPGFIAGMNSTLGNHTETVQGRVWKQLQDKAASTPVLSFFHALGNMQFKDAYNGLQTIARGDIAKLEQFVKSGVTVLNALNPAQKVGVYKYFSTKDADPMEMDVTPLQREILVKNKEAIRTLGKHMYEAGLIPKDTYEKNEDAYLHIVYLKYIDMYRGSNKKTSVLSFLQKRKNKSEREKLALGMIKDPEFLVPETLGTMGRDVILLNMFSNISNLSKDNNLHWVIHKNSRVAIPGLGKTRVDIDDAYKTLDEWNFIIDAHMKGDKDVFGTNSELGSKGIEWLIDNRAKLVDRLDNIQNEALQKAFSDAKTKGLTTTENVNDFLLKHYVRMPQKKQMGVLSNKWVRKEIANDLDAYTSSFTFGDNNAVEKFFSKGGTLERVNRLWKLSMVALNPGSWFRNIAGNFALLDLSTSTNKLVLMKMLHEEVVNTFKNTPSNYWLLANEYGLFGATWSAVELQDFNNRYGDDLKRAKLEYEARNGGSAIDKQLHFLDERFLSIGRMLAHQTGAKTSKLYALVEGAFKTVSFRDYIQTWEAQNKEEFPRGIKDLDDTQKQIVYSKAAVHANDAIFDYSQVDGLTKTLRRIPFGAPFITFTMKALPASLKAMVNNPIKFAEYATLPMLLTMVAMAANDWDDDDITQFKKALPEYYKHNAGLTFLPFKYDKNDKDDKVQILSLDYVIPWSQWHNGIRGAYDIFAEDTGGSPTLNTLRGVSVFANRLGFLGGPTPTFLAAMLTGQDAFMDKPIMTPGASGSQQLGELMTYAYNMAAPPWLSSHGWFSKLADAYGIGGNGEPTVNAFGDVKFTPYQAWADITGFRSTSVNESGILANRKRYDAQIREIQTFRRKVIKDRNLSFEERAIELRAANDRLKLMKQQKADNT